MDLLVRDLVEHLQTYPGDTRLRFSVICLDETVAAADDYQMRRCEDGSHELRISGALVKQVVADDESGANVIRDQKP